MSNIGETLKQARQKKGLDIEEVYLETKISPRILKALEENRAKELVSFVYAKNFLKKYANFLGLNGEEIVRQYAQGREPETDEAGSLNVVMEKPKPIKMNIVKNILIASLILILIGSIIYGFARLIKRFSGRSASKPGIVLLKPRPASSAFPIPKNKKLKLTITTTDKVWIQIKADGHIINQNILDKSSNETWQANKNFELWIGKPDAVKLELNGKALSLPKNKKIKGLIIDRQGLKF